MLHPQLGHLPGDYRSAADEIARHGLSRHGHASRAGLDLLSALVKAAENQLPYFFYLPGPQAEVTAHARGNPRVALAVHYLAVLVAEPTTEGSGAAFCAIVDWAEAVGGDAVCGVLAAAAEELEAAATPESLGRLLRAVLLADGGPGGERAADLRLVEYRDATGKPRPTDGDNGRSGPVHYPFRPDLGRQVAELSAA